LTHTYKSFISRIVYILSTIVCIHINLFNDSILGNKGSLLCEMTRMGLTVPHGFVITTEACNEYYTQETFLQHLNAEIIQGTFYICT
jgi:hypothetical protein